MPRGSSGASGSASSSGSGGRYNFRGVEQSLHIMRQVKSYFNVGMDHVVEVAADMADYGKGDEGQAKKLRQIMLNYLQMERDMDIFMKATDDVIKRGADCEEEGGLVGMLERQVQELSQNHDDETLKEHEKYTELEQKIWDSQHPNAVPSSLAGNTDALEEEDVEMTQEQVNTRCPYTGKEMVEPVRNVICKHTYDKAGITQHIKQRGNKALCPVGGCKNNKPITLKDLEDHKEMRRYIHGKKKRPQPSASTSAAGSTQDQDSS